MKISYFMTSLFPIPIIVCRTADLYLSSSIGSGLKERPQLNLTVRKELKGLGGKIIAQSGMAKVRGHKQCNNVLCDKVCLYKL